MHIAAIACDMMEALTEQDRSAVPPNATIRKIGSLERYRASKAELDLSLDGISGDAGTFPNTWQLGRNPKVGRTPAPVVLHKDKTMAFHTVRSGNPSRTVGATYNRRFTLRGQGGSEQLSPDARFFREKRTAIAMLSVGCGREFRGV